MDGGAAGAVVGKPKGFSLSWPRLKQGPAGAKRIALLGLNANGRRAQVGEQFCAVNSAFIGKVDEFDSGQWAGCP